MQRNTRLSILSLPFSAFSRTVCLALISTAVACGGGSSTVNDGKPTAAQLKTACTAVFDKVISCSTDPSSAVALAVATNYKATACTDANAQSFAACSSAAALYSQAQTCAGLDCTMASSCGLALVPSLQACMPDGGT
jgi:hypothetical protein